MHRKMECWDDGIVERQENTLGDGVVLESRSRRVTRRIGLGKGLTGKAMSGTALYCTIAFFFLYRTPQTELTPSGNLGDK